MALVEYWIGTSGPFLAEDTDLEMSYPGQVVRNEQLPVPATTVTDETTYGITPAVGISVKYARQDHTHGTPSSPMSPPPADGKLYCWRGGVGWEELVIT